MKTQTESPTVEAPVTSAPIRVRIRKGEFVYYGGALWREGQVLDIDRPEEFSNRAMERVAPTARLSNPMSPKDALDRATRIIRYGRYGLEPPDEHETRDTIEVI
jgi:hypothetical protein